MSVGLEEAPLMSIPDVARFVERRIETYGSEREDDVVLLLERHGVTRERATDGIRLGLLRGLFVRRTGDDSDWVLKRRRPWQELF